MRVKYTDYKQGDVKITIEDDNSGLKTTLRNSRKAIQKFRRRRRLKNLN